MLKELSGRIIVFACLIQSCVGEKNMTYNQNKYTTDTAAFGKFDGIWKFQKKSTSISVDCDEVEFNFKGAKLFYRADKDTFFTWAVISISDSNRVNYIYNPTSVVLDRYRINYSNTFINKFYYLNDHNVSPFRNPCLRGLDSALKNVTKYGLKDNSLVFFNSENEVITLIR